MATADHKDGKLNYNFRLHVRFILLPEHIGLSSDKHFQCSFSHFALNSGELDKTVDLMVEAKRGMGTGSHT